LADVRRFREAWEKQASVRPRQGQRSAIDAYHAHDRIVDGTREELVAEAYGRWKTDIDEGLTSLRSPVTARPSPSSTAAPALIASPPVTSTAST
jgi:hypothetical protein